MIGGAIGGGIAWANDREGRKWATGERDKDWIRQGWRDAVGRRWQTEDRDWWGDWMGDEARKNRDWQTGERQGSERWQTGERQGHEDWQSWESSKERDWRSGESSKERDWRSGESSRERDWRTGERESEQDWRSGESAADRDLRRWEEENEWMNRRRQQESGQEWSSGENRADRESREGMQDKDLESRRQGQERDIEAAKEQAILNQELAGYRTGAAAYGANQAGLNKPPAYTPQGRIDTESVNPGLDKPRTEKIANDSALHGSPYRLGTKFANPTASPNVLASPELMPFGNNNRTHKPMILPKPEGGVRMPARDRDRTYVGNALVGRVPRTDIPASMRGYDPTLAAGHRANGASARTTANAPLSGNKPKSLVKRVLTGEPVGRLGTKPRAQRSNL